jgi:ATP-dependent protease HslVU (ClpYQ) peptidase subunit
MTCIAAIAKDNKIYMSCDSCISNDSEFYLLPANESKIKIDNNIIYGYCGTFRFGQVVQNCWKIPENIKYSKDTTDWYIPLTDSLFKLAKAKRCLEKDAQGNILSSIEGSLILGIDGCIYNILPDLSIAKIGTDTFFAIGSGSDYALGSLITTKLSNNYTVEERLVYALEAASLLRTDVKAPFISYVLNFNKEE